MATFEKCNPLNRTSERKGRATGGATVLRFLPIVCRRFGQLMKNQRNICGRRLGKIRMQKGFTQRQLAARMQVYGSEIDRSKISKIEAGIRSIDDLDLWHLSLALGVGVEVFFQGIKPLLRMNPIRDFI